MESKNQIYKKFINKGLCFLQQIYTIKRKDICTIGFLKQGGPSFP